MVGFPNYMEIIMTKFVRCLIAFAVVCNIASAQVEPAPQENCSWYGDQIIVSDGDYLTVEDANGQIVKKIQRPPMSICSYAIDGHGYSLSVDTSSKTMILWKTDDFVSWEKIGNTNAQAKARLIIPLTSGKYLLSSAQRFFCLNGVHSPFAVAKLNQSKQFEITEIINIHLANPFLVQSDNGVGLNPKYKALEQALYATNIVRVPGYIVLPAMHTGYLFVFNEYSGKIINIKKVFNSVSEEFLANRDDIEWCVLGIQATKDNNILLATRSEDAVIMARRSFPNKMNKNVIQNTEKIREVEDAQRKSLVAFPDVCWWSFNPKTGVIKEEAAPINVPNKVFSLEILNDFRFRFKPDGNLKMLYK